jgi:hypothetical protein
MLVPVQATLQGVLGGQFAFGIDIAAIDANRGEPTKRARSAAAWSVIRVARISASMPSSAATRSTSANAAGKFGQCSTYSTSTTGPGWWSSKCGDMPPSPARTAAADPIRAVVQRSKPMTPFLEPGRQGGRGILGCRGLAQGRRLSLRSGNDGGLSDVTPHATTIPDRPTSSVELPSGQLRYGLGEFARMGRRQRRWVVGPWRACGPIASPSRPAAGRHGGAAWGGLGRRLGPGGREHRLH